MGGTTASDIAFEVFKCRQSEGAITVEFPLRASHAGEFAGFAATGKPIELPVVGIYSFDTDGKLLQETSRSIPPRVSPRSAPDRSSTTGLE